jgi:hypothetical protein
VRIPRFARLLAALSVLSLSRPAAADLPTGDSIIGYGLLFLAPHDAGVLLADGNAWFALGWSLQIPVSEGRRHRVVMGLDWNPASSTHPVRGRLGYRFAWRYPFVGFGLSADRSGVTYSPELGVRLFHDRKTEDRTPNFAWHLLVRADLAAPVPDDLDAVTSLVGWTLF